MPQKSQTRMVPIKEFGGDSKELARLRSEHSLYTIYKSHWDLCMSAYEGGPDFCNELNIFRHFRENEDDFRDRSRRLHYINYCEQLVDFYTNFIFSETIDRNGGQNQPWYDEFIKNVDQKGTSLEQYMRRISDETQIYGMCYTLVDTPPTPSQLQGQAITVQQAKDFKLAAYWCYIRPTEVTDWVVDDFGNYQYVKRRQVYSEPDPTTNTIRIFEMYTEMYTSKTVVTKVDLTDPTHPQVLPAVTTPNTLNVIPLYTHRYKRSKRYPHMGNSFLRDFAYNNREIMNLTSLLQEFLYRQCFNVLVKEIESGIPITSQQDGILGTANVLEIPKGAEMPKYLSPPSDPAKFIAAERDSIKQEMFVRASEDAMNQLFNGQGASGFSKSQSFSKTVPFIAARADGLEHAENALMTITLKLEGKEWDGRVLYKDHYDVTNLTDAMTQFVMITRDMQMPSETFTKTELKRIVKEFDGKLDSKTMEAVMSEIDAMNFKTWQADQLEALVGAPSSPADQQMPKGTNTTAESKAESMKVPNTNATKKLKQS